MFEKKDYSKFTLEELVKEEIKVRKSSKFWSALAFTGLGMTIYWAFTRDTIIFPLVISLVSGALSLKYSNNLKAMEREINSRKVQ